MKMAVVVYQAGIANVFRVQSMLDLTGRERLLQGTFGACEQFARGLACAGVVVRSMYCNQAGDISDARWVWSNEDAPFKDSMHPVCVMHPPSWPDASERKSITFEDGTVDGKRISFHGATEFFVQVGKGRGSYKTRNRVVGNFAQAVALYRAINIGNGYKSVSSCRHARVTQSSQSRLANDARNGARRPTRMRYPRHTRCVHPFILHHVRACR